MLSGTWSASFFLQFLAKGVDEPVPQIPEALLEAKRVEVEDAGTAATAEVVKSSVRSCSINFER